MERLNELTPSQLSAVVGLVVVAIIAGIVLVAGIMSAISVSKKQVNIDMMRGE